ARVWCEDLGGKRAAQELLLDPALVRLMVDGDPAGERRTRVEELDRRQDPVDRLEGLERGRWLGEACGCASRGDEARAIGRAGRVTGHALAAPGPDSLAHPGGSALRGRLIEDARGARSGRACRLKLRWGNRGWA